MIIYEGAKFHPLLLLKFNGSVFPFSCLVAVPGALISVLLKLYGTWESDEDSFVLGLGDADTVAGHAWSAVSSLLGFLVVFRTSQAYSRFWEGCAAMHQMVGEWFDATSSLIAFCKMSSADPSDVAVFQHTLVRLVSLLNAVVLMDLASGSHNAGSRPSSRAFELELIDAEGIDKHSLMCINTTDEKVELIFHWIQQLIVENLHRNLFSVQAPIMSRVFQELANGMVRYHDAMKIARVPLPFPYMQTMELLLVMHWLVCPVLTCMWIKTPLWAGVLTFMQIFFFWSLNSIACELENPFGEDVNDLPAQEMQLNVNKKLLLLLRPSTLRTARLSSAASLDEHLEGNGTAKEGRLGKRAAIGKKGVPTSVPPKTNEWLSRRITLGCLQEAILDEAVVELEEVYDESEHGEQTGGDPTTPHSKENSVHSAEHPTFRIREVVKSCRTASLELNTQPAANRTCSSELNPGGPQAPGPPPVRSVSRHGTLTSEFQGLEKTSRRLGRGALEERLLQTGETSAQRLQELVNICEELRNTARDATSSCSPKTTGGFGPRLLQDGGSGAPGMLWKQPAAGRTLLDPGASGAASPTASGRGTPPRRSREMRRSPSKEPMICCTAQSAGASQRIQTSARAPPE